MFTRRGITVSLAGVGMWFAARILGSPGLEVVGIGLAALPFVAAGSLRVTRRHVSIERHLSETRMLPGTRLTVELDVRNASITPTSFLLLEDRLPPTLGRPARLLVTGVPARGRQRITYTVLPQTRGRYTVGPLMVDATDAFGLTRQRAEVFDVDHLLVTPEIEDLNTPPDAASGANVGSARARQLLRTGEDFYTMRGYQEGDDLRRIHWPSVARTGSLMIRQDEASRRATGVLFLDNRQATLGQAHGPAFERAVSCAASVGVLFLKNGFNLRLATAELPATTYAEDPFLDALAGITHARSALLTNALGHLRAAASPDAALVMIAAPPSPQDLPTVLRTVSGFGPKLAILVHPTDPDTAPPDRREQLQSRATQAQLTLLRAGWDCIVLSPSMRLTQRWHIPRERRLVSNA
ncbi:MAG: DUF58 domain-containing protein [Actinomycetota bacterium]